MRLVTLTSPKDRTQELTVGTSAKVHWRPHLCRPRLGRWPLCSCLFLIQYQLVTHTQTHIHIPYWCQSSLHISLLLLVRFASKNGPRTSQVTTPFGAHNVSSVDSVIKVSQTGHKTARARWHHPELQFAQLDLCRTQSKWLATQTKA